MKPTSKPGLILQHEPRSRRSLCRAGFLSAMSHHVPVAGDVVGQDLCGSSARAAWPVPPPLIKRHRADSLRADALALSCCHRASRSRPETSPWAAASFDHLRRPHDAAACIVTAKDRHDHSVVGADVLEPAEDACRDVEDVAFLQRDLPGGRPSGPRRNRQRP